MIDTGRFGVPQSTLTVLTPLGPDTLLAEHAGQPDWMELLAMRMLLRISSACYGRHLQDEVGKISSLSITHAIFNSDTWCHSW